MPAFLHCPGVQRAHQYPCDHQPLGDAPASNRGVGAVIEILQSGNEMLREAGYSAEPVRIGSRDALVFESDTVLRSEEHTSELQSLMRISYAVFCLKKKNTQNRQAKTTSQFSTTLYDTG